ncbi:glycosyl hydrolase [Jatrophihabitans sp.]|uniref:glycosyl hydrolase n=1 Tax=Jatrophihabitans sp. TaxID=1932789 RepID=UPI0030C7741F|nr:glycoside hydrolase family 26 [Jatrophihabitans sp.]
MRNTCLRRRATALVAATSALLAGSAVVGIAAATATTPAVSFTTLGQQTLDGTSLETRCASDSARFNSHDFGGGFATDGPTGIAIAASGRIFVADDGGQRVLSWKNADALTTCQAADIVIGAGELEGPEAVTVDGAGTLYVADTLDHTVKIFTHVGSVYTLAHTLGQSGVAGSGFNQFDYPRGLAVDENGRLFVADDDNNRVLIFNAPFTNGESAVDSIYGSADGHFGGVKALAISGDTLFVADYYDSRVLRFTGPFNNPSTTYASTAIFTGVSRPVDLAIGPDSSLYVSDQGASGGGTGTQHIAVYADAVLTKTSLTKPTTTFASRIDSALGMAADASGRLFISEYSDFRVLIRKAPVSTAPIDPSATPATVALLASLRSDQGRATGAVSIGQEMATYLAPKNTGYYREFATLTAQGNRTPVIMSTELSYLVPSRNPGAISTMIAHANAGGVIAIDWHPDNPVPGGTYDKPITTSQLGQIVTPGTTAYTNWNSQVATAEAVLAQFAAAGVPVLFRPFVETNGNKFFWWGNDNSTGAAHRSREAAFRNLWSGLVSSTETDGLHNLLYVYSANALSQGAAVPAMDYYPGDSLVDVNGLDIYQESLYLNGGDKGLNEYAELVSTGKPFGMSEFGQSVGNSGTDPNGAAWDARTVATRVVDSYPKTVYAIAWYSTIGSPNYTFGLSDVSHTADLLANPLIKSLPVGTP